MRVQDLSPPDRRLLRLAGRVEPNAFEFTPGENPAVESLVEKGLLRRTTIFGGQVKAVAITEAGRKALG